MGSKLRKNKIIYLRSFKEMENLAEEIFRGKDLVKQLQNLIQKPFCDHLEISQQKLLADKLFGSLNEAISVMNSGSSEYSSEVRKIPSSSNDQRSPDSHFGHIFKRPAVEDQMSSCKKRKVSESWIEVSSSKVDKYVWRKYGQKKTRTFPRCYFRCTHKHEQGCKATKQVQKIQEKPIKYQITYFGQHTCRETTEPNNLEILDSYSQESNLINFQCYKPSDIYPSPACINSVKEDNNEVQSDLKSLDEFLLPDSMAWSDLTPLMEFDISEDYLKGISSYETSIGYHGKDTEFSFECDDFTNSFYTIY